MKKKRIIAITAFMAIAVSAGILFAALRRQNYNNHIDYRQELTSKCTELVSALLHSEIDGYLGLETIASSMGGSSRTALDISLNSFQESEDYSGLGLRLDIQKNNPSKQALISAGFDFRNVALLSGRLYIEDSLIKLQVPKLYKDILTVDTAAFSGDADKSVLGNMLENLIDLSLIQNLNYDTLFGSKISWSSDMPVIRLVSEFQELYPDDWDTISQNITVTKAQDFYTLTLKAEAMKIFVTDLGNFLFESPRIHRGFSRYLEQKYKTDPHISSYYTLEEYQKQYLSAARESVTDTANIIADLINFDISVNFHLDASGKISRISYRQGNENLSADLEFQFTPVGNTADMTGCFFVTVMDTEYGFHLKKETTVSDSRIALDWSADWEKEQEIKGTASLASVLEKADNMQNIRFSFSGEDSGFFQGALSYDMPADDHIAVFLSDFTVSMNNRTLISLTGSYDLTSLDNEISLPKGKEYDILNLKMTELAEIISKITGNLEKLKGQFKL